MKKLITLTACLFLVSASFAQKNAPVANDFIKAQRNLVATGRCAFNGTIADMHNHGIVNAQLFIYGPDSSIIASGYTNASGAYETNAVLKGKYVVKVVYPNAKALMINDAMLKKPGYTPLNIIADMPTADTTIAFAEFMPKPVEKHGKVAKTVSSTTTTVTKVTTTTTTTGAVKTATGAVKTATLAPTPMKK
jgi:hypothetical protein